MQEVQIGPLFVIETNVATNFKERVHVFVQKTVQKALIITKS